MRRSRRSFGAVYAIVSALVILLAVFGGVTVFFRLEQYEIVGTTRYSRTDIINATGLSKGDNLYFFNKFSVQEDFCRELPYVGSVRLTRRLPKTLVITLSETEAAAAIADGGAYVLIDPEGKVLERSAAPGDAAVVTGVTVTEAIPGEPVRYEISRQEDTLREIFRVLREHGLLHSVDSITLSGAYDVTATYMGKVEIRLGLAGTRTDRKIRALGKILDELPEDSAGVLDMTGEDYRFLPAAAAPSPTPTVSPEPTPEG